MSFVSRLGIAQRLQAAVGLTALVCIAVATLTMARMDGIIAKAHITQERRVPQLSQMAEIELNITRVSLQLRHAMLSRTPQEQAQTLEDVAARRTQIEAMLADYERGLFTAEGKERFARLPAVMADFWRVGGENLALIQAGRKDEAFAFLVDRTIPARNRLLEQLDATVNYQKEALAKDLAAIEAESQATERMVL
ncbi:MAG: MCP four helix bundle domain-containing protein, partial [Ideonella sp.]|nr:MCP four helix bundle domain-containing protein [Ideonella sp.]